MKLGVVLCSLSSIGRLFRKIRSSPCVLVVSENRHISITRQISPDADHDARSDVRPLLLTGVFPRVGGRGSSHDQCWTTP